MRTWFVIVALVLAGGAAWGETKPASKKKTTRTTSKTTTNKSTTVKKVDPPATPDVAGWEPIGIPECDAYLSRMYVCSQSPNFPAAGKQAVLDALKQAKDGWKGVTANPEATKAANDACRQANDAMSEAADALCPGVWPRKPQPAPAPAK